MKYTYNKEYLMRDENPGSRSWESFTIVVTGMICGRNLCGK